MSTEHSVPIERMVPRGSRHPLATEPELAARSEILRETQGIKELAAFLRSEAERIPGVNVEDIRTSEGRRPHVEKFIISREEGIKVVDLADLQAQLAQAGSEIKFLGIHSWGNANQMVTSAVQGINPLKPGSGFERPTVAEGPHMILAPYAFDSQGKLHVFRTLQGRIGEVMVDTPRGFADSSSLESGEQMYDIDGAGEKVEANLTRIVGEEAGEGLLKINKIVYLGSPVVNRSFVTSQSALFGVEVDYDNFVKCQKVVSPEEFVRREEQLEHEGLLGTILDMTVDEYIAYKTDSSVRRDLAADGPADIIVMNHLARLHKEVSEREVGLLKYLQETNPEIYLACLAHINASTSGEMTPPPTSN